MTTGIELKFLILFAILIALTGFTFESQQTRDENRLDSLTEVSQVTDQIHNQVNNQVSTLTEQFTQP